MSDTMTVAQAFDAAVAMEESARQVHLRLAEKFDAVAGARAGEFFRSLADDETEHVRLWGEIRKSLPASRLAEEASGLLAASLIGARGLLEADPAGKVESLAQAVELVRNVENAELLAVFRVLAIELVPDARRREFLDAQIQGHLNRIERFAHGLGS